MFGIFPLKMTNILSIIKIVSSYFSFDRLSDQLSHISSKSDKHFMIPASIIVNKIFWTFMD